MFTYRYSVSGVDMVNFSRIALVSSAGLYGTSSQENDNSGEQVKKRACVRLWDGYCGREGLVGAR